MLKDSDCWKFQLIYFSLHLFIPIIAQLNCINFTFVLPCIVIDFF